MKWGKDAEETGFYGSRRMRLLAQWLKEKVGLNEMQFRSIFKCCWSSVWSRNFSHTLNSLQKNATKMRTKKLSNLGLFSDDNETAAMV